MKFICIGLFCLTTMVLQAQVSMTIQNFPSCSSSWCDGSAQVSFQDVNDNSPYTIEFYHPNSIPDLQGTGTATTNDTTISIYNLCSYGDLLIYIIDVNGDTTSGFSLLPYYPFNASVGNCTCSYGTIFGFAAGGHPPYTYSINVGAQPPIIIVDSSGVVLLTGFSCEFSVSATISDAWGCSEYVTPPVDGGCGFGADSTCIKEVYLTAFPESDTGACDGYMVWELDNVDTTTTHELIYYNYAYSIFDTTILAPGVLTDTVFNLCDGTYTFKVDKDSVCPDISTAIIEEPTPQSTFLSADSTQSCANCNGTINWSFTDYFYNAPYLLQILDSANNVVDSAQFNWTSTSGTSEVCPGDYQVIVIASNGDTISTTTTVLLNTNPLILNVDQVVMADQGQQNGAIFVSASGGTPPYLYSIDGGSTWQTSNVFLGLGAGIYTILTQDATSCEVSLNATVDELNTDGILVNESILRIYPNPASDKIYCQTGELYQYSLVDSKGSVIMKGQIGNGHSANVSSLANGLYLLNLVNDAGSYRLKIIIE